ncbi:hypothetical protein CASFOL_007375 [Castilleja foliolosa]|uniref:Calmodulin-binding domain-containing protein n=1 Tax=Castilleja foliolosa TaxID=1961234 RepID=A0ABD3E9S7_9LAMI
MASRPTRDNTALMKEKRGPSPSNIPTTTTRTTATRVPSPNPPKKPASPARTHNPTTSEKSVPNYLKGTVSSVDLSKQQGKKPVTKPETGTNPNPTLARRRSFDKPPSTSQSQNSRISPSPTLRSSSSFSGKITSPQKSVPVRNSRMPKEAGKQHTLYARPVNTVKKIYVKKSDMRVDSSTTKEKVVVTGEKVEDVNIHDVPEPKTQNEDQETIPIEVIEKRENDYSSPKNQEPISYEQIVNLESSIISEPKNDEEIENKDAEIAPTESSMVSEHQVPVKIEQIEGKIEHKDNTEDSVANDQEQVDIKQIEEDNKNNDSEIENLELNGNIEHGITKVEIVESLDINEPKDIKQDELKEDTINEVNFMINNNDESVAGNDISENVKDKKIEEEAEAEIGSSQKDEAASDGEAHETEEIQVEVAVEKKPETENEASKVQMAHGKKEIPVSNGVIEETASKLREQRKNKVRALAGAFETVISLQEK